MAAFLNYCLELLLSKYKNKYKLEKELPNSEARL